MVSNGVYQAPDADAPLNGLFSVAEVVEHGSRDEHWIGGYTVESDICGTKIRTLPLCTATDTDAIDVFDNSDAERFFHVMGFGIIATIECNNSVGFNATDGRARVVEKVVDATEYAVEQEIWHGDIAQRDADTQTTPSRWLTNATSVSSTGVKPKVALGLVESAFGRANPGVRATIHITPMIAAVLGNDLDERGGKLYTSNGSMVAINRGGDGESGPAAGGSATKHWIYATGPVHVDLGNEELITVSPGDVVNSKTNAVIYAAERPAAVYFDGCEWFGALADATL